MNATHSGPRSYGKAGAGETRRSLLDAGLSVFSEKGFSGARVEEIASRAGVNKAMINYHFGGKQGLHTAILEDILGQVDAGLSALRDPAEPADERLRRFIALFGDLARRRPGFPPMVLREAISGGRHVAPHVLSHLVQVLDTVRVILEQGVRDGLFRRTHPLNTYLILQGALIFFFATSSFRERIFEEERPGFEAPTPESFLAQLETLLLDGLRKHPSALDDGRNS